jgi:hypothetical protein
MGFWKSQLNYIKGVAQTPPIPEGQPVRPVNKAGWAKYKFDQWADDLVDTSMYAAYKGGLVIGGVAAAAGGTYLAAKNPESLGVVAPVLGAVAGAGIGAAFARTALIKKGTYTMGKGGGLKGFLNSSLTPGVNAAGRHAALAGQGKLAARGGAIGLALGAGIGAMGVNAALEDPGNGLAKGAITAGLVGGAMAFGPKAVGGFAKAAFGSMGGLQGMALGAAQAGMGLAGTAIGVLKTAEFGARAILTGGRHGIQSPLDAWFPNARNLAPFEKGRSFVNADARKQYRAMREMGMINKGEMLPGMTKMRVHHDVRRFAPNPSVIRRGTALVAAAGVASFAADVLSPGAAPVSAFFDGRNMRHVNDRGANANYAQGVLGRNSDLNVDYNMMARTAAAVM